MIDEHEIVTRKAITMSPAFHPSSPSVGRRLSSETGLRLRRFMLVCVGLLFSLPALADEPAECGNQPHEASAILGQQGDRLRMCALIGIWDSVIVGNNRHGYSGEAVAWVDDSVTNLDLLQCERLEPAALAGDAHGVAGFSEKE